MVQGSIPDQAVSFAPFAPNLLKEFNSFRSSAIELLKVTSNLKSCEQALSLNGIMLLTAQQNNPYYISAEIWIRIAQAYKTKCIGGFQFSQEEIVSDTVQDFEWACTQNGNASDILEELMEGWGSSPVEKKSQGNGEKSDGIRFLKLETQRAV